ncbi:MAG: trehalose-phosphatase [Betaproteobacteria bacterium]
MNCALFLDIDGTLLDLAPTPDSVTVDAGIKTLLPALVLRLAGAVALVTGRALADADQLFPGLSLPVAGQHGLERRTAGGSIHGHESPSPGLRTLHRDLAQFAAKHKGLLLEDKGTSLALHFRLAPRLASFVHRSLKAQLAASGAAKGLHLQPGKGVLEIKPNGRDKGTAILEYMTEPPFAGRLPVFVGDDQTDEYGFAAVMRAGGWAVKVGPGRTRAQFRLPDVAAVRGWLGHQGGGVPAPVPILRSRRSSTSPI